MGRTTRALKRSVLTYHCVVRPHGIGFIARFPAFPREKVKARTMRALLREVRKHLEHGALLVHSVSGTYPPDRKPTGRNLRKEDARVIRVRVTVQPRYVRMEFTPQPFVHPLQRNNLCHNGRSY
ncbi:MAG: hypothetical protein Q7T01_01735 [bacterium]|nr:hypothetical protein [bacterium]